MICIGHFVSLDSAQNETDFLRTGNFIWFKLSLLEHYWSIHIGLPLMPLHQCLKKANSNEFIGVRNDVMTVEYTTYKNIPFTDCPLVFQSLIFWSTTFDLPTQSDWNADSFTGSAILPWWHTNILELFWKVVTFFLGQCNTSRHLSMQVGDIIMEKSSSFWVIVWNFFSSDRYFVQG